MRQHGKSIPLGLYTIGIAALFLAGFFLLVVLGAHSYQNTVTMQHENMRTRGLLSYLTTTMKGNDTADCIVIDSSQQYGQVIIIDDGNGYSLRLYSYQGNLMEDYGQSDAPLNPAEAQVIDQTKRFNVDLYDDVLTVETDVGSIMVHLRSQGGELD